MRANPYALSLGALVLVVAGAAGGYWAAHRATPDATPAATPQAGKAALIDPATGKKVLYWHDPMVPGQKFDKPGKSPFMDMMLVPVFAEDGEDDGSTVSVSPRLRQNLGIRTATVTQGEVSERIEAVGTIAFDERQTVLVQARANGFVEKLFVRAPLDPVVRGQALAELFVPEWAGAQQEYLAISALKSEDAQPLRAAARQRMLLLGMPESLVAEVERGGAPRTRVTVTAPASGVVAELGAREGMTVSVGAPLFRIAGTANAWVLADVAESRTAGLRPGSAVDVRVAAWPGEPFKGRLTQILPEVNPATRTLKARVEVANADGRLKPGMFASLGFGSASHRALLVPSEALIPTGRRIVVYVADGGRYAQTEVKTGLEQAGMTEVTEGLSAGQTVVVSGQFLLDSEANLRSGGRRLDADAKPGTEQPTGSGK